MQNGAVRLCKPSRRRLASRGLAPRDSWDLAQRNSLIGRGQVDASGA